MTAKANEINNDMTNEHQRYFNKSIEDLTFRVNEERKFKLINKQKSIFLTTYKLNNSIDRRLLVRLPPLDYQSNGYFGG